jgi:hypothetical protein
MGYFSNGSEGMEYMARYCERCVNFRDNGSGSEGCPIMDLHLLWNYDAVGKNADKAKTDALNHFIPRDGIYNGQCTMFQLPVLPTQRELERAGQLRMDLQKG